ncbi:phosphatidate cytidylyltransferase [Alkalisalibacterium limincola]|uniref:Phosphatidate cytidylyltransferase n=1 Tax=Alkalisalibacterium limincola TaxID=2699169 RepID=A0A5C8KR11_9GAMM|nr:phosphatidate cytidylyltransferase [Alkalisalibacterium limincola]TXK62156.1 phosphatidate cytidylyltransferase [Alkalisalibacterium limincola]
MKKQRVLAAAVMTPVAIAIVLLLPTHWLAGVFAVTLLLALWELSRMVGVEHTIGRVAYLAGNAAIMAWLAWFGLPGLGLVIVLLGVMFWLLVCLWLLRFDFASGDGAGPRLLKLLAGSLAVIPAWVALGILHAGNPGEPALVGPGWALLVLAMIWASDTGAYFTGMRFGRRKLSPRISPNKTWEGFWGGMALSVAVGLAVAPFLGVGLAQLPAMALLAAAVCVAAVIGDLFESLIKRHAGCKDSGTLIPGHGGVYDRLDSVLAALPVAVLVKAVLGL